MSTFADFLQQAFQGRVRLRERLVLSPSEWPAVEKLLADVHARRVLDLAGPTPRLEMEWALAGARVLADACWFLLTRDEPPEAVEGALQMPVPASASQHLSADHCLRYLPAVHARAAALCPDDVLTRTLSDILRKCPLSGVLARISAEPTTPLNFEGHPGLQMLYAERLANHPRPLWVPQEGEARQWAERVWAERGLGNLPEHVQE
jgi:hypothetical protein